MYFRTHIKMDSIANISNSLDSINEQLFLIEQTLEEIRSDGTDYDADIRVFAIPLIIAVVALMIPFIFSIITRIDSKYVARNFSALLTHQWQFITFFVIAGLCIATICLYAIFRKYTLALGWRIVLVALSIFLLLGAIAVLLHALKLNNPQKLLEYIFYKYNNGLANNKGQKTFYSLCTQLTHYAIVNDITLLHNLVNIYAEKHIQTIACYNIDTYNSIIDIAADYKEKEDDREVNSALSFSFASFVDCTSDGNTEQDTYNALLHVMYLCIRNKHYTLINDFQRRMRYAYYTISQNAQNNKNERLNRLRLFVIILNSLLYGNQCIKCVDDAISNNFDAVIIGDATILPIMSNYCIDLYLYLKEVLLWGKEYEYYCFVASDFTSKTNITLLNKYFAGYFGYLIKKMHQYPLCEEDLNYSIHLRNDSIKFDFEALVKNAPDGETMTYIQEQQKSFTRCRAKVILARPINKELSEIVFSERIEHKNLPLTFKGISTFDSIYMQNADGLHHPILKSGSIDRRFLQDESLTNNEGLVPIYDVGSPAIKCIMDDLADIYNSFEQIEEIVHKDNLHNRIMEFVCHYDYSFLTLGVNVSNQVKPFGEKFSNYFSSPCVIIISIPDLPYIEYTESQCTLDSINRIKTGTNEIPQVSFEVDFHINIHYKRNTIIHVLKIDN